MTLEEINKRLEKNPYYQGSQAQKEAEAGVKIQNNNVIIPEQSKAQVEQIRKEYGNENISNNNQISTNRERKYINIPVSKNKLNLNRTRLTQYMDTNDKDTLNFLRKYTDYRKTEDSKLGRALINSSKVSNDIAQTGKNLVLSVPQGVTQLGSMIENTYDKLKNTPYIGTFDKSKWENGNYLNEDYQKDKQAYKDAQNERMKAAKEVELKRNSLNAIFNREKWEEELNKANKILEEKKELEKKAEEKYNSWSPKSALTTNEQVINDIQEQISKNTESTETKVGKWASEIAPSVGNMAVGTVATAINPKLGATYFAGSAAGGYSLDAKNRGATDDQAYKYGIALGTAEGLTEMIGVGHLLKGGKEIGKGAIKEAFKHYGVNIADNFIQEAMMEPIQEGANELILGESDWTDINKRMLKSGINGALVALIMDGASSGIASSVNLVNKVKNNQAITQNDINIAQRDLNTAINKISELEQNKGTVGERLQLPMRDSSDVSGRLQSSTTNISNNIIPQIQDNTTQKQISPLNEQAQINYDIKSFAKQVDAVKNGTFPKRDMLTLGRTPKVLQELGLKDLPITMTQKHLDTIMNESGKYKGANYHGLGEDIVKKLPEALNNPLDILKSSTKDDSIVLTTDLSDKQDRTIIASIKIDGTGKVNNVDISTNVMTSSYGKDNYDRFMQDNIKAGNLLYDIDQGIIKKIDKKTVSERLQLPMTNSLDESGRLQLSTGNISINNIIPQNQNYASTNKKVLNPAEISNLTLKNAGTTPDLPNINYKTDGKSQSRFYNNLMSKTDMLNDNVRGLIKNTEDIKYYQGVTNEQSLAEAYNRLNKDGSKETMRWFNKDLTDKNASVSATEVAEGWILLKQYQDAGDYESAVNVAKKMRDMATKSGQALQAYSIQARLTPEGMFQYAQSELQEAFEKFSKNKTQEWIDKHKSDFDLTPEETQAIIEKVKEAQELPNDSQEKKNKLGEINKIITDKLPPERGAGIKAWMRISMLFNSKTQVRNVLGNAVIAPVNSVSDVFSTIADKALSKKTGVRTTGLSNPIQNIKGFGKGLYNSYNDFKKGINTREISGDRFEIGQGKSFKDKGLGKYLNKVDHLLSFMLDVGDRPFYEATFTNSINNQLVLNNTDVVTKDMIDIATNEALSRTWQDNNAYTKAVLGIRKDLNKLGNIGGYGLGDVFIPFAKTPANLTKAIIDYSPVGMVTSLIEGNNVRKAISRGDLTAQQQHKFVQDLGKATVGSMLYILGYALAKAGITSGESDEDKDVANFIKNNLGTSQYSIKIGDKTFTYDWAQPVAAPIAMMANLVGKKKEDTDTLNKILDTLDVPMNMLLEQSFMSSIKDVFSNYNGLPQAIFEEIAGLPSRAVPTLLKQITDMTDTTQRTSYEKGKPIQTAVNQVKAKIPGLSKQLAPVSNTLGKDIKKYGGETDPFLYAFHTFINPANVNSNQKNKAGSEIYKVYKKTGDKTIFPRQAEYTQTIDGTKITLTSNERYQYQKTSGKYYSNVVNELLKSDTYKSLSSKNKAEILKEIANDSNEKAKEELAKNKKLEYEREKTDVKIEELVNNDLEHSNAYIYKTQIKDIDGDKDSNGKTISSSSNAKQAKYIMEMDTDDSQKDKLLSLLSDTDTVPTVSDLKKLNGEYLTYMQQSGKKQDGVSQRDKYMMYIDAGIPVKILNKYYSEIGKIEGTKNSNGRTISGSKKNALFNYINNLDINATQKKILFTKCNSSYGKNYKNEIFNYINSLNVSKQRKEQIWKELYE